MLILFSAKNFRSISDEQELSLVASDQYDKARDSRVRARREENLIRVDLPGLGGVSYLRGAAIYGANGSGKSNVVHALARMDEMVLRSAEYRSAVDLPYEPFRLDEHSHSEPTAFFASFHWNGVRFEYEFSYDSERILSERLVEYPKGRPRLAFSRTTSSNDQVEIKGNLPVNSTIRSLIGPYRLVLSFFYANPTLVKRAAVQAAGDFFERGLLVLDNVASRWSEFPYSGEVIRRSIGTDYQREVMQKMVADADIGINSMYVRTDVLGRDEVLEEARRLGIDPERVPREHHTMMARHGAGTTSSDFDFSIESFGTLQLFALSGFVALALETGATLVVDELDASLHPKLVTGIVKMFHASQTHGKHPQLIFTMHQTSLLSDKVLERDQVWFTDKDVDGATRLYPLSDYATRNDEALERGYLTGRYDAVPVLPDSYGDVPLPKGEPNE